MIIDIHGHGTVVYVNFVASLAICTVAGQAQSSAVLQCALPA